MRSFVQFVLYIIFVGFSVRFNPLLYPLAGALCIALSIGWWRSYSFSSLELKVITYTLIFGLGTGLFSMFNTEDTGLRYACYIVFFLIPSGFSLMVVASKSGMKTSIAILSVCLTALFFLGRIEYNRYQQVGNQLVYSGISMGGVYLGIALIILLYIGSRQSFLAILVVLATLFYRKGTKIWRLGLVTSIILIFVNGEKIILYLGESILASSRTISRLLLKINSEGGEERLDIWANTINRIKLVPIGHDYTYENFNLPHNLFLEILHVFGILLGSILLLPLLRFLFVQIVRRGNMLMLASLIPALLSNGPAAYKYLFLFALTQIKNEDLYSKLS